MESRDNPRSNLNYNDGMSSVNLSTSDFVMLCGLGFAALILLACVCRLYCGRIQKAKNNFFTRNGGINMKASSRRGTMQEASGNKGSGMIRMHMD